MADVIAIARLRRRRIHLALKNEWRFRDRDDPFQMNENEFVKRFRLSRMAVRDLCEELRPHLQSVHGGYAIEMQVLSSLQVLGTGSFQSAVTSTNFSQISQPTLSRNLKKFTKAVCKIFKNYVQFPVTNNELLQTKENFYLNTGFPNCVGAIDCTQINIIKPTDFDWFVFLNRKSKYSINVQMVCDNNMRILDVVARWPGSTHDSSIWKNSGLRELFFNRIIPEKNFLIGDSGYPLESWLMTPYSDESSQRKKKFNDIQRKARNVIERCFGLLKSRFRCLDDTGGTLQYTPEKVCEIIITCSVLHNICLKYNIESDILTCDNDFNDTGVYSSEVNSDNQNTLRNRGKMLRDEISLNL